MRINHVFLPGRMLPTLLGLALSSALTHADMLWCDGTRDPANEPPGKLLSENPGYWGDCVLTGVQYRYETPPSEPGDQWRDDPGSFGRRLLDGRRTWNWWTSVGGPGGQLRVVFDFQRPCVFREVDLDTRSRKLGVVLQVADEPEGPWQEVYSRSWEECPDQQFHRLRLEQPAEGRYLRLSVNAPSHLWLDEVLVWGDAEVSEEYPEAYRPLVTPEVVSGCAFSSIPGIAKTALSDARFWDWQREIGDRVQQPAVWSRVPTWDSITHRPLLPTLEELCEDVDLPMARNETECVALALTSTDWERPRRLTLSLSPFRRVGGPETDRVVGAVRIAGAIGSRWYGTNLGPLLSADNMPGKSLLRRYLTNAEGVVDFPQVLLSAAGSAVLWVSVTTYDAEPGQYEATLSAGDGVDLTLRATVLDVTLPAPRVWVQTYSGTTSMFPFIYSDRPEQEVAFKQSLGITVWNGWPEDGSEAALARRRGQPFFHVWGIGDYGHRLYGGGIDPDQLTDEDERQIAELIRGHVRKAQELGLSYEDWYVELTDEPGKGNSPAFGALCRLIRKADPQVRIYCNPSFWVGNGVLPDDEVAEVLEPWYRECVDVSAPIYLLLRDRPRCMALFDAPRPVRAFYTVSTHSAKSEQADCVQLYRRLAWDAAALGWNGWGFYSYYAPREDPWNDFDRDWYTGEDMPDYLMVYPGPRGPIPTRQSEAVREGWEDYCLLTLLRQQGNQRQLDDLLHGLQAGEELTALRLRALRAAAEGSGSR